MLVALFLLSLGAVHEDWELAGRDAGTDVYVRQAEGAEEGEVLAVAVLDVRPLVAKIAIDDFEAARGRMPFLKESRVLARDHGGGLIVYNRTSAPLVADRDYTVRVVDASYARDDGAIVYVSRFRCANHLGPPPLPGVVRVQHSEGEWRFEPIDGGRRTRAVYRVSLDIHEDALPGAVLRWGAVQMMSGIVGALRDRVADPKYATQALAQSEGVGASSAPGTLGR